MLEIIQNCQQDEEMAEISVQPIGARRSLWGEGPVWWQQRLLYVDIQGHAIVELNCENGDESIYPIGERVGMMVPATDGNWLYAGDSGIVYYDVQSARHRVLADPEASKRPDNRFNDGKCDPQGRLWAGTISTVKKTGDAALYCYDSKKGCRQVLSGLTNSNGLCWSSCMQVFYHIDTPTNQVRAYPFDARSGTIGSPRVVIDTEANGLPGCPDGMTIDENGNLWVALCHGGAVFCCEPGSGKILHLLSFPAIETTSCCFGGNNLERLFVTTGLPPKNKVPEADAGRVFVVDGLGVRGLPTVPFAI
jgi:sugar lactone lactonase YvrE